MDSSKDYTILKVEKRDKWHGAYGDFQSYVMQLEGVDGWVEISQKPETPAPQPGSTIHGYYTATTKGDNTYLKFKKVNPGYDRGPSQPTHVSQLVSEPSKITDEKLDYIIEMLEQLTGKRDVVPTDIDDGPIDLSEIPF